MTIYEGSIVYLAVGEMADEILDSPKAVVDYMANAFPDPTVEWFYAIALNRKNRPLHRIVITKGTANASLVHPRELFKPVILSGATACIAVHNHPSGDPAPSAPDIKVTRHIRQAAEVLQIDFLDHIIIGSPSADPLGKGYYSFQEAGLV